MNKAFLEDVLRSAPWVEVVVSSTWRYGRSLEDFQAMFSDDVRSRLVGMTPNYAELEDIRETLVGYTREAECVAWLCQHGHASEPWLALDDRAWLFRPFNSNAFLVDGRFGLNQGAAEELLVALQVS